MQCRSATRLPERIFARLNRGEMAFRSLRDVD
jgi:hypothetical protein